MSNIGLNKINENYFCNARATAQSAEEELTAGLDLLNKIDKPITTIYGSHKVERGSHDFDLCHELATKLAQQGFAIASGGGSGIMEAANSAAKEVGTYSIAFRGAAFKDEHIEADLYTHSLDFRFIFARRFILSIKSDALIVFPGGYGTLNELFEILVLMQSKIIEPVPVILMRKSYWSGLFDWLNEKLVGENMLTNHAADLEIFSFADTADEALKIIQSTRSSAEHHNREDVCEL